MKNLKLFAILALFSSALISCDKDINDRYVPSKSVVDAFNQTFTSTKDVEWEQFGVYERVDFKIESIQYEAWFSNKGTWVMTRHSIDFSELPSIVKSGFQNSKYSNWKIDEIRILERVNMPINYVIEVESSNVEMALYFDQNGSLIKENTIKVEGTVIVLPDAVRNYLQNTYISFVVISVELETGDFLEVEIIENNIVKELIFDPQRQWIQTTWDISVAAVPSEVITPVQQNYPGYSISDVTYYQTPIRSDYYLFELKKSLEPNVEVKVLLNGTIIN